VFDINATGAAVPKRTITGSGDYQGIHVDVANNEIFVVDRAIPGVIAVYGRLASGAAVPTRTLLTDGDPRGIYVDSTANGSMSPARTRC